MKIITLFKKVIHSLREKGFKATVKKVIAVLRAHKISFGSKRASISYEPFMDVLFINGCDPDAAPHPPRYRVSHQKEQLLACNIVPNEVYYTNLSMDQVRNYRVFIFFRCPYTPLIGEFIQEAKKLHKAVLFDIDDLVFDTKYTDTIPYVRSLTPEEKQVYDDGVRRMGKVLSLCDAAITTTEGLAEELRKIVPDVFINRNTASERMLRLSEEFIQKREAAKASGSDANIVRMGYFSGSITHNADFEMILPALVRILRENKNVQLHIVGELTVPEALEPFPDQVIRREFVDWQKLPELIGSVDINLAPIEKGIFNEAKSENKWVEAVLVKVPTVASDCGAFKSMIENNRTGLLCDTVQDWYLALKRLVSDANERRRIGEDAFEFCRKHCVTIYTGVPLANYIRSKMTRNVAFVLPSLEISGGIMVALKHASFLFDEGFDTFLISEVPGNGWVEYEGHKFPVISKNHHPMYGSIDKAVATMWTTTLFLEQYPNIREKYYLVQNYETDFYTAEVFLRIQANQSYMSYFPMKYITISRWCQSWLREPFGKEAAYAPNGIDAAHFRPHKRVLGKKIRILIEGDCAVHYKNVDESFKIADLLDRERFEIWYMSYNAQPKEEYRVDRFLHRVPYEKVFEVYAQCDILLKSSFLESFSYPPLEMMASGGYVVVVPNDGNVEYLRDRENCLLYKKGDLEEAVRCIREICEDQGLQDRLFAKGLETARSRDWGNLRGDVLALYDI